MSNAVRLGYHQNHYLHLMGEAEGLWIPWGMRAWPRGELNSSEKKILDSLADRGLVEPVTVDDVAVETIYQVNGVPVDTDIGMVGRIETYRIVASTL